jgi:hypothetical protein
VTAPSVGRMVHYVSYGTPRGEFTSECRAAIVAGVDEFSSTLQLAVVNPTGIFFHECPYDSEKSGGTWHWPERA